MSLSTSSLPAFAVVPSVASGLRTSFVPSRSRFAPPRRLRLPRARFPLRACAEFSPPHGRSDGGSRDEEFELSDTPRSFDSERAESEKEPSNDMFEFIKTVPPPELVSRFAKVAPPVVQKAIRQTIVTMLGSLPPAAFTPTVTTVSANIVQLFHSSLIAGYLFKNAALRLGLSRSFSSDARNFDASFAPQLSAGSDSIDDDDARSTSSTSSESTGPGIIGGVAVFKTATGENVEVPVEEYVADLRAQVDELRGELARERKGGNELLSFISTLEPENVEALTANAGEEVTDAMRRVVEAVTRAQGIPDQPDAVVDASSPELGQLLFYLMVVGFTLRETEVRGELQRTLGGPKLNYANLLGESGNGFSGGAADDDKD
jgi:Protein of unknown function (DUF760)